MARYKDAVCKLCRNEGVKLFLKGERCDSPKCAIAKRPYGSGMHGQARKKLSEYALQLREKQKVRRSYGLLEKQFYRSFLVASRKKGVTGTLLFQEIESRFDNILYRSGIVSSRAQGRQWITHGHFMINDKPVDIASYVLKPGDFITVRVGSVQLIKNFLETSRKLAQVPHWLEVDMNLLKVTYKAPPEREDIDHTIKEQLIIEYYSR